MFEEKDFIMKQIKNIAKGLGKFLGVVEIKDIIFLDENQSRALKDRELESIVAVAKMESIYNNSRFSNEDLTSQLNLATDRIQELFQNEDTATSDEISKINDFISNNNQYL